MEISYDLTREDFWAFNRYAMFNLQPFKRNMLVNSIVMYVVAAAVAIAVRVPTAGVIALALVGGTTGVAALWWLTKRQTIRLLDGKPGMLGTHTLHLSEAGVRESTEVNDSLTKWPGVRSVVEDKAHIYLFIETHMAHVVPKRAFGSEQEAQRFFQEAKSLWLTYRGERA